MDRQMYRQVDICNCRVAFATEKRILGNSILLGIRNLKKFKSKYKAAHDSTSFTGCPTKNYTLFWRAVAPLNFELRIKVGGVLESSGSQLFKTVPTFDFGPSKS